MSEWVIHRVLWWTQEGPEGNIVVFMEPRGGPGREEFNL